MINVYSNSLILSITEGSTYIYEFIPSNSSLNSGLSNFIFESHIKDLNPSLNASNFYYLLTFQRDYWKAIDYWKNAIKWVNINKSTYITINKSEYDPLESGVVVGRRVYVVIKVVSVGVDSVVVNVTLSVVDGYARFGLRFSPLPVTDTGWSLKNEYYTSYFNHLNMSKLLTIDKNNHNTKDTTQSNLGEWPFWLKNTKNKYETILYNLDDYLFFPGFDLNFSGEARVIFLNTSRQSFSDFSIGNVRIKSADQIYSNKWLLPSEMKILNVTSEEKGHIIDSIENLYNSSEMKTVLNSSVIPLNIQYENNSIILFKDIISTSVDLSNKPWIYIKDAAMERSNYDKHHQMINIIRGIEYNRLKYFTAGFPNLKNVSYERNSGLLLYITVKINQLGSLDSIFPSVIVRAFGIVGFELTKYQEISMRLISIIKTSY